MSIISVLRRKSMISLSSWGVLASQPMMYSELSVLISLRNCWRLWRKCCHGLGLQRTFLTKPLYCWCQVVPSLLIVSSRGHTRYAVITYNEQVPSILNCCQAHCPRSSLPDCLCRFRILPSVNWHTPPGSFRFLAVWSSLQHAVTNLIFARW